MKRRWFQTERGNDADPRRAARRLAVQFTALIVVLLSLAGVVVYYLAAAGAEQALQDRLDSAAALNNPRDAPLDIFLAVYDRGRLRWLPVAGKSRKRSRRPEQPFGC